MRTANLSRQALCDIAARAAERMGAEPGDTWAEIAHRVRCRAEYAKTGRALTRLVRMAAYCEIQDGVSAGVYTTTQAQFMWATYARTGRIGIPA